MKYQQIVATNKGIITTDEDIVPGYRHEEGIQFSTEDLTYQMMKVMAEFIQECYSNPLGSESPIRMLDIGSGASALGFHMQKLFTNLEVVSIDGNPDTINSPFIEKSTHIIARSDEEYNIVDQNGDTVKFDLIVSFEHIEHIEEKNLKCFLENISRHSSENTKFLMSISGQEYDEELAHVHCHIKTSDEWEKLLSQEPYVSCGPPLEVVHVAAGIQRYKQTLSLYQNRAPVDRIVFLIKQHLFEAGKYFEYKFYDWFLVLPGMKNYNQEGLKNLEALSGWISRLNLGTLLVRKGANSIAK